MSHVKNMVGLRFGMVLVLSRAGKTIDGQATWLCQCECGNSKEIRGADLRNGHTTSCGCFGAAVRSEAGVVARGCRRNSKHSSHSVWKGMMSRCHNKNSPNFYLYGARGITVCEPWHDFNKFFDDFGSTRPSDDLSIDRIDNNDGYHIDNVRWATQEQQQNNRRDTIKIAFDGKVLSMSQWARSIGISLQGLKYRLLNNWPLVHALTLPPEKNRRIL